MVIPAISSCSDGMKMAKFMWGIHHVHIICRQTGFAKCPMAWGFWTSLSMYLLEIIPPTFGWCSTRSLVNPCVILTLSPKHVGFPLYTPLHTGIPVDTFLFCVMRQLQRHGGLILVTLREWMRLTFECHMTMENYGYQPLSMGKTTISTGSFSIANCSFTRFLFS